VASTAKRAWYQSKLEDPSILDHAVDLGYDLAVPVGGKRRGGYVCPPDLAAYKVTMETLARHDGFPNLRIIPGNDEVPDNICWGDDGPALPNTNDDDSWARFDAARGQYFGYSDRAIRSYIEQKYESYATDEAVVRYHPSDSEATCR